jgi:hypothetical protein
MKHSGKRAGEIILRRLPILLIVIFLMGPAAIRAAVFQPGYSSSFALVVGINKYDHWPNLEYAARDAGEIAAVLRQKGFTVFTLTNHKATKKNILGRLERIRQSVDANSRVVFYFAGHGQTEDLPGGRERGYIVPVDADAYDWRGTMLAMDQLNRTIKKIMAKHILLAFDSCYSGLGLTRSIKRFSPQDAVYIKKMMQTRSIQILTAGSRDEQAVETEGHGLFTDHLLAALNGAADINSDGHITATEIYATVRPSITKLSFSRQTPQFGYIEGNGDIIFNHDPAIRDHTAVVIDTRVDGIDVWAGNAEIGHRLTAGRHRLAALAGPTTIIVKKGGQTLYMEKVDLQANRPFPIRIGSGRPQSRHREPFEVLTIAHRTVWNYSNSIAYDLDADGREEIVTAAGSTVYAIKADGSTLWERRFKFPITVDLVEDWNSQPAIGLSGVDDADVHLVLLDSDGQEVWHHVRRIKQYYRGKPDGSGRIARLADIDLDGRKEVIAIATTNRMLKPRGIIVYDRHAAELWRYLMGPKPQNVLVWEDREGRPQIIISSFSSNDGNWEEHNGTRDRNAFILSVDGEGKTRWGIPVGGHYTGVRILLDNSNYSNSKYLYAHKYTSFKLREDEGGIYKISKSGKILQRFDTEYSILSMAMAPSAATPEPGVYAADNRRTLYRLDDRLNLLQKKSLESLSSGGECRIAGVHDYDGDGRNDVLLYSFERLMSDKNPLAAVRPKGKVFYSKLKFQIYSKDFSRLIKSSSLSEGWEKQYGFTVTDLNRPEGRHYPFMALSDKIRVYNY